MRKVIQQLVVSGFQRYTVWSLTYGSASLQRDVFAFTVETRGSPGPIPYAEPLRNDVGILTGVPDSPIQKGWMNYWWDTHAYQQDARDILDELTKRNVKLSLGGSIHDPTDPVGRLLFNVLAMVAEFESDLIRLRTREGMKVARATGRLRGKQPNLKPKHLLELHDSGNYTQAELAELFGVGRSTIYRTVDRMRPKPINLSGHSPTMCRRRRTPKSALHGNLTRPSNAAVGRYRRAYRSKQEAPTSVGASSSGTAFSKGGNSRMPHFPARG